ncbi:MAG: hypothetical protein J1F42_05930 [Lachnospiraceae bacterium]|nr:hypothetical protein [Lachnospiraceae bacterium]
MMEQYKKETSQIHAPAELIRKTKEAMWEEEQRLNREGMQRNVTAQPKPSYSKVYKWAFPIAAAAVFCVMLFSVSMMRFGSGSGTAKSNSPMDMASGATEANDMGLQFGSADIAEEMEGAAEEPIEKGGSKYDMTAGAAATAENNVNWDAASKGDGYTDAEVQSEDKSYIDSLYGNSDLWVEEVKEIPAFYGNPDTECIAVQDTELYVGKDSDGAWIAYVQVDSKMYVINTVLTDEVISREEFADKAYELLMEEEII